MSDDFHLDQFDPGPRPAVGEQLAFGEVPYPWRTSIAFDGPPAPAPRRAELLGDAEEGWWADVTAWTTWAIGTFRLGHWFPQCWPRHPALVEEAQALWLLWCDAWLPGLNPSAPVGFLYNLSLALNRIETLWQISCRDSHTEPLPEHAAPPARDRTTVRIRPLTRDWWSLEIFDPAATSW